MTRWFFMSYAHVEAHRDSLMVQEFFDDLCAEVASKTTSASSQCGYLDQYDLDVGDAWKDDLAEALCRCRTLVCIMNARYFRRPYCGREWQLFESRCNALAAAGGQTPRLIIPVLWDKPVGRELPEFATDLQFSVSLRDVVDDTEKRYLSDLPNRGLRHIMKRRTSTHLNAYETIREALATRIIESAHATPLPDMPRADLPRLDQITPRFPVSTATASPARPASPSRQANFVLVAGTADELRPEMGDRANRYGSDDAWEWTPYSPDDKTEFFMIAQNAASARELRCRWLSLDNDLIEELKTAKEKNSIALMVVDPWSARLPQYAKILRKFDNFVFHNCVVIIPWNASDCTPAERRELQNALHSSLEGRFALSNACYLRDNIPNAEEFQEQILDALRDLEEILAGRREPQRDMPRGRFESLPTIDSTGH